MTPILAEKNYLNPGETIKLFGLSERKFYAFLDHVLNPPFLSHYGKRKLINRELFEKYLQENPDMKEALARAYRKK